MCFMTFTGKVHQAENGRDGIKGPTHRPVLVLSLFCKIKYEAKVVERQLHSHKEDIFSMGHLNSELKR